MYPVTLSAIKGSGPDGWKKLMKDMLPNVEWTLFLSVVLVLSPGLHKCASFSSWKSLGRFSVGMCSHSSLPASVAQLSKHLSSSCRVGLTAWKVTTDRDVRRQLSPLRPQGASLCLKSFGESSCRAEPVTRLRRWPLGSSRGSSSWLSLVSSSLGYKSGVKAPLNWADCSEDKDTDVTSFRDKKEVGLFNYDHTNISDKTFIMLSCSLQSLPTSFGIGVRFYFVRTTELQLREGRWLAQGHTCTGWGLRAEYSPV